MLLYLLLLLFILSSMAVLFIILNKPKIEKYITIKEGIVEEFRIDYNTWETTIVFKEDGWSRTYKGIPNREIRINDKIQLRIDNNNRIIEIE